MSNPLASSVTDFWFGTEALTPEVAQARMPLWFSSSKDTDFDIERRFGKLVTAAGAGALDSWKDNPDDLLALTLLLDQFPRNLHRGTAQAFAYDSRARQCTYKAIESNWFDHWHPLQGLFVLLPLEHSEAIEDQILCLEMTGKLGEKVGDEWQKMWSGFVDYAQKHLDIIAQFGRFPHRNRVLGRTTTAEEETWLNTSAERFGQG